MGLVAGMKPFWQLSIARLFQPPHGFVLGPSLQALGANYSVDKNPEIVTRIVYTLLNLDPLCSSSISNPGLRL